MKHTVSMTVLLAALTLATSSGCASSVQGQPAEQGIDDATVSAGVKGAIGREAVLKGSDIQVETVKGVVQLSGFVSSAEDVATAAAVARTVKGVKSVRNDLRLK